MGQRLLLVDGNSIINRAFYGCKSFLTSSSGVPTGAVNGFFNSVLSVVNEYRPSDMCVLFDLKAPTFRHELSSDYKATRKGMDPDLACQMPIVKEILDLMGIKRMELSGYEADDLIGTLSRMGEEQGMEVFIYSGDHDDYQLISDRVSVIMPCSKKDKPPRILYNRELFEEENGIPPEHFIYVKALMGDASDNIIGIDKIGPKTAFDLIAKYGDIDGVLSHIDELKPAQQKNLTGSEEKLALNLKLCTIDRYVPVPYGIEETSIPEIPDRQLLFDKLMDYQLKSLAKKLELDNLTPKIEIKTESDDETKNKVLNKIKNFLEVDKKTLCSSINESDVQSAAAEINQCLQSFQPDSYPVLGISFCTKDRKVIVGIRDTYKYWVMEADLFEALLDSIEFSNMGLEPAFVCCDYKPSSKILTKSVSTRYIAFDTKVCAYVLNFVEGSKIEFSDIFNRATGITYPYGFDEPKQMDMMDILLMETETQDNDRYLREIQDLTLNLYVAVIEASEIIRQGISELIYDIELPLIHTLDHIERNGMSVSAEMLTELHGELSERIQTVEQEIYDMVGEVFNISSPKQLGSILYDKLKLPAGKKSKTGSYSTSVEELNRLKPYSPVIDKIILYRKLTKLDSTYAVGLKTYIDGDERIHTTFTQVMTNTGRLSSLEPNLQNIPVKTDEGGRIREAFKAPSGKVLVDADYSQIELRLLAHLSGDKVMCESFNNDMDIHMSTAMELYGVPADFLSSKMRSAAKTVNFSIIYGITPYGLSNDLGVSFGEAKQLIDEYHKRFCGVTAYLEGLKAQGEAEGFVDTMFGRRRYINEFKSTNHSVREFGYRAAMNTPIQGSAADIIKLAMIGVDQALSKDYPTAKFVMQVHDEIIVECEEEQAEAISALIKRVMEEVVKLNIPLRADVGIGKDWLEAK